MIDTPFQPIIPHKVPTTNDYSYHLPIVQNRKRYNKSTKSIENTKKESIETTTNELLLANTM